LLRRAFHLGRNRTEQSKLKIAVGNAKAQSGVITENKPGETKKLTSIRKVAK